MLPQYPDHLDNLARLDVDQFKVKFMNLLNDLKFVPTYKRTETENGFIQVPQMDFFLHKKHLLNKLPSNDLRDAIIAMMVAAEPICDIKQVANSISDLQFEFPPVSAIPGEHIAELDQAFDDFRAKFEVDRPDPSHMPLNPLGFYNDVIWETR